MDTTKRIWLILTAVLLILLAAACTAVATEPSLQDNQKTAVDTAAGKNPVQETAVEAQPAQAEDPTATPEPPKDPANDPSPTKDRANDPQPTKDVTAVTPPAKDPASQPAPEKDPSSQPVPDKDRSTAVLKGTYDAEAAQAMAAFANNSLNAELKAIATMEHVTGSATFSSLGAVDGEGWCVTAKVRAGAERPTIYQTFILNTGSGLTVMPNEYSQEEFNNAGCSFYFDDFTEQK
ncbi:MAG TPA: hypothetical protein EYP41_13780 [Anaerolineae bacterium]|nr:hypothetical protein [Anaerolineae bacterium]HIP74010.1 hypothetical protein [Anaerolineae bacterium]